MIYFFFTFVLVACIACCGYFAGKVKRMEDTLLGERSSIALKIADLQDRVAKIEITEPLEEEEMERRIREQVEKRWDDGLQSIMNFNPLSGGKDEEQ